MRVHLVQKPYNAKMAYIHFTENRTDGFRSVFRISHITIKVCTSEPCRNVSLKDCNTRIFVDWNCVKARRINYGFKAAVAQHSTLVHLTRGTIER